MTGEPARRVQELRPCSWFPDCRPDKMEHEVQCFECSTDGQRWVTVGTLRQPTFATFGCRVLQPYLLDDGLSIREMDAEEAESGDRPLYVIEDTP